MVTTYFKNKILEDWFRNTKYDIPDTLYIGLSTTTPTDEGTNITEPTATSYKRLAIETNSDNWTSADNGRISNALTFRFNEAEEDWSTTTKPTTHYVIFDSEKGGNALFYDSFVRNQTIPAGAILEIPQGGLVTEIINA